jgi:hypothetical protein
MDPLHVVVLVVLLLSTAWCIPNLGVSYADLNSSSIGAITHNTTSSSSSRFNSSSSNSTVLLPHCHSTLQSSHHSKLPPATFHATTTGSWDTSPASASCPSKTTHHKLRHPWSINKGANRGILHHGLAAPTTPPWMRSPREKKY